MALIKICPTCGEKFVIQAGESKSRKYDRAECRRKSNRRNTKRGSGKKLPVDSVARMFVEQLGDLAQSEREKLVSVLTQYEVFRREHMRDLTLAGLAVSKAYGMKPGRPRRTSDEVIALVKEMRHDKHMSLQAIADELNACGVPTAQGGRWHPKTISDVARYAADQPQWHHSTVARTLSYALQR